MLLGGLWHGASQISPLGRSERAGAHRLQRMAQNQSLEATPAGGTMHWCFATFHFITMTRIVSIGKPRDMGCVGHTARHLDRMVHGHAGD